MNKSDCKRVHCVMNQNGNCIDTDKYVDHNGNESCMMEDCSMTLEDYNEHYINGDLDEIEYKPKYLKL